MAQYHGSLAGPSGALVRDYKLGGASSPLTLVRNSFVIWDDGPGTIQVATTTSAADLFGTISEDAVYSTTQGATEGVAETTYGPFSIFRARGYPGATAAAYAAGDTNLLTQGTADTAGVTIDDTTVGTATFAGGSIHAVSGANAGQSRIITTHNNAQDAVVTVPFLNDLAVGDLYISLPHQWGEAAVQLTTNLVDVNTLIANNTGAEFTVVDIVVSTDSPFTASSPSVEYFLAAGDHIFNKA